VSAALFDYQGDVTHPLVKVDPALITLERIPQAQLVAMQARASKAVWRPAPGRKNSYAVKHAGRIVGLMFLASPVINLGVRDEFLRLPKEGKGYALRCVADMSACVGLQPIAWHWNIGKLVAILATSNEIAADHEARYGDHLDWITTTSLYGRGAQYNRIYKFLGYSKGYGHAHVSEAEYQRMLAYMRDEGIEIPSSAFGAGSNPRMRRIAAYQRATGQKVALKHGDKRGVYIHAAAQGSVRELAAAWHARWGAPRYERTKDQQPPYTDGMAS
jgi:hypothetical protein